MYSQQYLRGFRSAVQAHGMDKPRGGAYDAKPSFTPRTRPRFFTRRTRATDQTPNEQEPDDNRPLSDELMEQLHNQLVPDTFQMLVDELNELNGTANDQKDPDEEEDKPATGLSPEELIDRICELVGPHLSDDDNEEFRQLLGGLSPNPAEDEPPSFSGRPTAGGGQDPISSASRARSSSPAEDARRIKSLTPGQLAYDNGTPFTGERNGYRYMQGVRLTNRPRMVSGSEQQSYASRFPGAARIKVL